MKNGSIYPSKVSYWLLVPAFIIITGTLVLQVIIRSWVGTAINVLVLAFITHLCLRTRYIIDGDKLIVRSGFLVNQSIAIDRIVSIKPTVTPISAPALSMDRLEIKYDKFKQVLISPREKEKFIGELKAINPAIQVK